MGKNVNFVLLLCFAALMQSCSPAGGNNPGTEYMPDMGHSVAYEPNIDNYYYYHTWGSKSDFRKLSTPREPVKGSIARGSVPGASTSSEGIHYTNNGSVAYYYGNTEEERLRAMSEITSNPLPISDKALASSKELYNIYCGICHGEKGDGAGYLVRDDGGKYPAQPANFLKDEFITASEGRFYHSIMRGRNLMNSYADKLSYEERWNVIHYIRSLQAASKNLKYSETENTFNNSKGISKPVIDTVIVFDPKSLKEEVKVIKSEPKKK